MDDPHLSAFAGLAELGARGGAEIRPTLLRVLTDLYVQKLTHTPEEERHYTELALRLIDAVDEPTRLVVASLLSRHLSPPMAVLRHLAGAQPLEAAAPSEPALPSPLLRAERDDEQSEETMPRPQAERAPDPSGVPAMPAQALDAATATQLNALFFAADAGERRLILRNLAIVAPLPSQHLPVARDGRIGERLEAAALSRKHEEFAQLLARALQIPRAQAHHILRDDLGEALVVAVKALGIAPEVLYRILLFANPSIGHSVERVNALAALYDEITPYAAEGMVAIWRALDDSGRAPAAYRPLTQGDEPRPRARPAAMTPVALAVPRFGERRDAS